MIRKKCLQSAIFFLNCIQDVNAHLIKVIITEQFKKAIFSHHIWEAIQGRSYILSGMHFGPKSQGKWGFTANQSTHL
jgi:hypothetical protein